jgi:hypothetical protein
MIVDLNSPLAGLRELKISVLLNLTVTVFVALTHPEKHPVETIDPLGTPIITASLNAAPVTVMVKSDDRPAEVLGKSKVAVLVNVGVYDFGEYAITTITTINANDIDNILYPKFLIIIISFLM